MIATLADALGLVQSALVAGFLVFLRIGAAMALLPAFGERIVPARVRLVLTLAFTAVVAPAVTPDVTSIEAGAALSPKVFLAEVVAGLALGIALRLFILALQTAGTIAAQATSLAQLFAGASVEPQPAISHLLVVAALALATMAGLHVRLAEFLVLSYDLFPAGRLPSPEALGAWGVERTAQAFALAFVLSAPFVIASLIYNLALGVINRAMPQLMVAFVGAPAITLGALGLLLVGAPLILAEWHRRLLLFVLNPSGGG
ncbi:flagellar biosynthetic protein FliR [Palleronia sp. KMU-117]|uniref:flagellar biosynthetic protein FliR n=1 Tax=Palleronia sp. KMU-117 TaxID=3434108 RepID=UPI003D717067